MSPAQLLSFIADIAAREVTKIGQMSQMDAGVLHPDHMEALLKLSKIAKAALDSDPEGDIPVEEMSTPRAIALLEGLKK